MPPPEIEIRWLYLARSFKVVVFIFSPSRRAKLVYDLKYLHNLLLVEVPGIGAMGDPDISFTN